MGPSSASLLQRVARGDTPAVQACIDTYGRLVWSLARRFCPAEAEDAAQDVFIELWSKAGRYDPTLSGETTFVAMIARRRLIDRNRRSARRPKAAAMVEDVPAATEEQERVDAGDEAALAATALRELRPEQQQVLKLAVLQGLTHQEVSEKLNLPLGTVKTHVRRGLIRLRELLGGPSAAPQQEVAT